MYEQRIDTARKLVAIVCAVCGAGVVVCANRAAYLRTTRGNWVGWDSGAFAFGTGMLFCLLATFALTVEAIFRQVYYWQHKRIQFSLRTLLIAMTLAALLCALIASLLKQHA